nr:DUF4115 domain-containing protein [Tumebacillus amylolyticus]
MNGQELLERHNLIQTSSETAPVESLRRAAKKSSTVEVSKSSIGNSRLLPQIVAGVGVLAVLVAAYVLLVKNESPKDTGQAQTQATANAQDVTPTTQATPTPTPAPTPAPQPQPEPPKPQATVTQSAKESNRTLYAVGNTDNLSLVLTAQDNCWIQVTADGKVVETGIVKVGESRTWTATKDIAVLTGKSKFITLKMNDLPVSFEPQLRGYTYEFQKK